MQKAEMEQELDLKRNMKKTYRDFVGFDFWMMIL